MIKELELRDKNSCINKARDDEMVFVLLGRDPAAAVAVRAWVAERVRLGLNCPEDGKLVSAEKAARIMEQQSLETTLARAGK